MAPGTPFTDVDKPLHLHITPGACSSEVLGTALCAVYSLPLHCQVTVVTCSLNEECPCWGCHLAHAHCLHAPAALSIEVLSGTGKFFEASCIGYGC